MGYIPKVIEQYPKRNEGWDAETMRIKMRELLNQNYNVYMSNI